MSPKFPNRLTKPPLLGGQFLQRMASEYKNSRNHEIFLILTPFLRIYDPNIVIHFGHLLFKVFTKIKNPVDPMVPELAPVGLFLGLQEVWVCKFDLKKKKFWFSESPVRRINGSAGSKNSDRTCRIQGPRQCWRDIEFFLILGF